MKKLKGSMGAKVVAWILAVVSSIIFVLSAVAVIAFEDLGVYRYTKVQTLQSAYENIAGRYAYRVMDHIDDETTSRNENYFFDGSNYQYGIIHVGNQDINEIDLNNESSYLESNFTEKIEDTNYQENEFYVTKNTYYYYGDSIWDFQYFYGDDSYEDNWYYIDKVVYEASSGIFYYDADGTYYPVKNPTVSVTLEDGSIVQLILKYVPESRNYQVEIAYEEADGTEFQQLIQEIAAKGTINLSELDNTILGYQNWGEINTEKNAYWFSDEIDFMYFSAEDVELASGTYQTDEYEEYIIENHNQEEEHYVVISLIPEGELIYDGDWENGDLFVKVKILVGIAYQMQYVVFAIAVISLVLFFAALIFLMGAAGHRKGTEEITALWIDKIPVEIFAGIIMIAEFMGLWLLVELSYWLEDGFFYILLFGFIAVAMELLGILFLLSFAVRVKLGKWWHNTIIGRMFGWCAGICKKAGEAIPLVWKTGVIFLGICFIELLVIGATAYEPGAELFLWFFEKVLLALLLLKAVTDLYKLKDAGEHLASGDTEYKADTQKMFPDFRKHGDNLNSIGNGIAKAVDERMKSERFKTELITNVSHDIKTPLTSIINYVDLLEKEELNNETAEEYLEVLDRQSARLKKLIEDLMEASKASTGNLPVNMELCEAGVFLVQTVGEFGERTEELGLDLMIKSPEYPLYIMADGRHFWRVIDNLMNNICKYAQPGTRVYIDMEAKNGRIEIVFRNTSKYPLNISSEELLERFVRGDSSRNTEGNGLGLNIAQNLTELMNGRFELVVDGDLFKVILSFPQVQNTNA
ncbi:MAG: sensor histidine kinase [Roseburia sp.]